MYFLKPGLDMIALTMTTIKSKAPTGISRYCCGTLKLSGRPNLSTPMIIAANAVPITEPLPPVDNVPPSTTAVIMGSVNVAPISDFAVPR